MITVKEAIEILRKSFPNRRMVDLFDYGEFYASSMPTNRWDGDPENTPGSSGLECVDKKTGKQYFYHIDDMLKDDIGLETEIDITPYLSEEEIAFVLRSKEMEKSNIT